MKRSFQYHDHPFHTDNRPLFLQFNPQVMTFDFTDKDNWKSTQAQIFQYFQITPLIIIEYVALWYLNIEYFSTDQLIGPYSAFIKTLLYLIIILLHLILIFSLIICIFKGFVFPHEQIMILSIYAFGKIEISEILTGENSYSSSGRNNYLYEYNTCFNMGVMFNFISCFLQIQGSN